MNLSLALPLPPPLRGEQVGSFAHYTMTQRLPSLAREVRQKNAFPPQVNARLEALQADLPHGRLRQLHNRLAPDALQWEVSLQPHLGQTWMQVPWFLGETYFFQRILEATGYFEEGPTRGLDPYLPIKQAGMNTQAEAIAALCEQAEHLAAAQVEDALSGLLLNSLWGNQGDLSMWSADGDRQDGNLPTPAAVSGEQQLQHLIVNDMQRIIAHLRSGDRRTLRLDLVQDNSGTELCADLILIDVLLSRQLAAQVHLHLKPLPTFISDTTPADLNWTLAALDRLSPAARNLSLRLRQYIEQGRLHLESDYYWVSPLPFWELPQHLYTSLQRSHLILVKGDANYRRLLGDRAWPFTTPFDAILSYRPAPLVALRVYKCEVGSGLQPGQAEALAARNPQWTTSGEWGILQFTG